MIQKKWNFPTGEYGVIVDGSSTTVHWDWTKEKDIYKICSQINAISNRLPYADITLDVPYLPYSRQDKMFNIGEANSLELMLKILASSCKPHQLAIKTLGVHNEEAFEYYCWQNNICRENEKFSLLQLGIDQETSNIVFPDKHAKDHFDITYSDITKGNIYYCNKVREPGTGNIVNFECDNIRNINLPTYILDDICDGGATFTKCANALIWKQGITDIRLFVYHGFFTKGIKCLIDAGINHIYTTDSVFKGGIYECDDFIDMNDYVTVIKLEGNK